MSFSSKTSVALMAVVIAIVASFSSISEAGFRHHKCCCPCPVVCVLPACAPAEVAPEAAPAAEACAPATPACAPATPACAPAAAPACAPACKYVCCKKHCRRCCCRCVCRCRCRCVRRCCCCFVAAPAAPACGNCGGGVTVTEPTPADPAAAPEK